LQPFGLVAAVVLLVEVGVDLGVVVAGVSRVVVAGRRGREGCGGVVVVGGGWLLNL
jgi:hypothetical protein